MIVATSMILATNDYVCGNRYNCNAYSFIAFNVDSNI
jgi:hypothetical protein